MQLNDLSKGSVTNKSWLKIVCNELKALNTESDNFQCENFNSNEIKTNLIQTQEPSTSAGADQNNQIVYRTTKLYNVENTGQSTYSITPNAANVEYDLIGNRNVLVGVYKNLTNTQEQYKMQYLATITNSSNTAGSFYIKFYMNNTMVTQSVGQLLSNNDYILGVDIYLNFFGWSNNAATCIMSGEVRYVRTGTSSNAISSAFWSDAISVPYINNQIKFDLKIYNTNAAPYTITRKMYYLNRTT